MKEKYEGLLRRELMLPPHYKILFKKFEFLGIAISAIKKTKSNPTLSNIQNFLKLDKIQFTIDDFKRILYIVPHFFIYKWEKIQIQNRNFPAELVIDIPNNIVQRLKVKLFYL